MSDFTREVYAAVQARGYTQGTMTREQYAFSQLCKMVSEVSEYADHFAVGLRDESDTKLFIHWLQTAAGFANALFNNKDAIGYIFPLWTEDEAQRELADVLVTVAMSAEVLRCDVEALALAKARGDVKRGVREAQRSVSQDSL